MNSGNDNKPCSSRLLQRLEWLEESAIATLLGLMTLIAFANVITRRIFSGSIIWALELTLYLFLILVLFAMSYALRKGLHVGVDVIVNRLKAGPKRIVHVLAGLITALYAICFASAGLAIANKFLSNPFLRKIGSDDLDIPHWLTYGFMGTAFAWLALNALWASWQIYQGKRTSITASHEAEQQVAQSDTNSGANQ